MPEAYHILMLGQVSARGLKRFPHNYVVSDQVNEPDAILVRSQNMHEMVIPSTVKAIARAGAGTNNIPVQRMNDRGVPVFNAPGANANAVKELVIAAILIASRNLVQAIRFVNTLQGDDETLGKKVEEGKKQFSGFELPHRSLGIIGLGAIGGMVADAAIKLGMRVIGFDPEITVEAAWSVPSQAKKAHSIDELLKYSDFISLHVPLVDATKNMIDANHVNKMRQGVVLLNFARDGLVDEDAVLAALGSKKIRYYMCDFPSAKLKDQPGVVALPHLGASTQEAEDNCGVMVVDQVRDYLENGNILNAVNFPNVIMMRESPYRVGIANANVPNMVGQISTTMAQAGLNIHNMMNKSKGAMAYTLVDVDSPVSGKVIQQIASISGVLSVRNLPAQVK
ncbi:MAG TPA: phosphoglycerate dehydrogenase [Burkholderiales bacterium]|nr:phosphoglycerate dehydrogenase [Burkholderiales bacterium]